VPRNRREKEEVPGAAVQKQHLLSYYYTTGRSTTAHVTSGTV